MNVLKFLAVALFISSTFFPAWSHSQTPTRPPNLIETLNKEARATDPAGIHDYSEDLIKMLLGNSAGPDYAASLSDRLSRAELMTRQEKRKLISEADIARAFNNLMSETGAPDSLRADDAAVKAGRAAFEKEMPALISQQRNGTYCNPGEAVFIVSMLIENIGRSATPSSQSDHNAHVSSGHPAPVRTHLALFCANHSRSDVTKLFNRLFNVFLI